MIRAFGTDKEHFLLNLERIQERAAKAQRQITSGYRVEKPSDAPHQLVDISELQLRIAHAEQRLVNLQRAQSDVKTNETALQNAVKILQDVTVTGTQGADSHADAGERRLLAERVKGWHSELVRIANLHHSGRYQFSGDQDGVAPYAIDLSQPGGVVRAHNSPDTRLVEDAAGNLYPISRRAQDTFDLRDSSDAPTAGNVFHAVHTLYSALEANDPDAVASALDTLGTAAKHLNEELSTYGTAMNRLDASIAQANKIKLGAVTELAAIRETDIAAAAMEMTQASTSLETTLAAQARLPRTSLFDYLA